MSSHRRGRRLVPIQQTETMIQPRPPTVDVLLTSGIGVISMSFTEMIARELSFFMDSRRHGLYPCSNPPLHDRTHPGEAFHPFCGRMREYSAYVVGMKVYDGKTLRDHVIEDACEHVDSSKRSANLGHGLSVVTEQCNRTNCLLQPAVGVTTDRGAKPMVTMYHRSLGGESLPCQLGGRTIATGDIHMEPEQINVRALRVCAADLAHANFSPSTCVNEHSDAQLLQRFLAMPSEISICGEYVPPERGSGPLPVREGGKVVEALDGLKVIYQDQKTMRGSAVLKIAFQEITFIIAASGFLVGAVGEVMELNVDQKIKCVTFINPQRGVLHSSMNPRRFITNDMQDVLSAICVAPKSMLPLAAYVEDSEPTLGIRHHVKSFVWKGGAHLEEELANDGTSVLLYAGWPTRSESVAAASGITWSCIKDVTDVQVGKLAREQCGLMYDRLLKQYAKRPGRPEGPQLTYLRVVGLDGFMRHVESFLRHNIGCFEGHNGELSAVIDSSGLDSAVSPREQLALLRLMSGGCSAIMPPHDDKPIPTLLMLKSNARERYVPFGYMDTHVLFYTGGAGCQFMQTIAGMPVTPGSWWDPRAQREAVCLVPNLCAMEGSFLVSNGRRSFYVDPVIRAGVLYLLGSEEREDGVIDLQTNERPTEIQVFTSHYYIYLRLVTAGDDQYVEGCVLGGPRSSNMVKTDTRLKQTEARGRKVRFQFPARMLLVRGSSFAAARVGASFYDALEHPYFEEDD
jgi:hypothetical protein